MKLIGLDVGTKRIGVAKADSAVRIAVPQGTIAVDGTEFEQLARLARVHGTTFFVVGLPRNNNGEETAQSQYSREFAKKLKSKIHGAKVAFQDESLTSVEAETRLKSRKKKSSIEKGEVDSEAAAIILQDFLENFANGKLKTPEYSSTGVMPKVERKKRLQKKTKRIIASALGVIVVIFTTLVVSYASSLTPVAGGVDCSNDEAIAKNLESCQYKTLTIEDGMSVDTISALLKQKDLIKNPLTFKIYLKLHGLASQLKVGRYSFNKQSSVQDIVATIVDGSAGVVTFRLTTLPGATLDDFRKTLLHNGYSETEIEEAFAAEYDHPVLKDKPADASLEGYIFGETIEYHKGASVESIIKSYLDELYKNVISYNLEAKFREHGLSLHEGIILASVVQKEAATADDMALVASVFYNRLAIGQHLGSDATIKYYLDLVDKNRSTYSDNASALAADSCYNTGENYGHAGLPCGAISNPGLSALRAVASPADSSYLYFLTGDDGKMYYGNTADEHNSNRATYCQSLCDASL